MDQIMFGEHDEYEFNDNGLTYHHNIGNTIEQLKKSWTIHDRDIIDYSVIGSLTNNPVIAIDTINGNVAINFDSAWRIDINDIISWMDTVKDPTRIPDGETLKPIDSSNSSSKAKSSYVISEKVGRYSLNYKEIKRESSFSISDAKSQRAWSIPRNNIADYEVTKSVGEGTSGHIITKTILGSSLFGSIGAAVGLASGLSKQIKLHELSITIISKTGSKFYVNAIVDFGYSGKNKSIKLNSIEYQSIMGSTDKIVNWLDSAISDNKRNNRI